MFDDFLHSASGFTWGVAILLSIVGTVTHFVVCIILLIVPDRDRATKLWLQLVPGMPFERPGSALRYILAPIVPEMYSLYCLCAHHDTQRLFAMQIFVLGGVSTFDRLMLSSPSQIDAQMSMLKIVEPLFFVALLTAGDATASTVARCLEAVKLAIGANIAGFLWALLTTRTLRAVRLAKLCAPPPAAKGA